MTVFDIVGTVEQVERVDLPPSTCAPRQLLMARPWLSWWPSAPLSSKRTPYATATYEFTKTPILKDDAIPPATAVTTTLTQKMYEMNNDNNPTTRTGIISLILHHAHTCKLLPHVRRQPADCNTRTACFWPILYTTSDV
eukprot:4003864-Amphidinium_carterae.1